MPKQQLEFPKNIAGNEDEEHDQILSNLPSIQDIRNSYELAKNHSDKKLLEQNTTRLMMTLVELKQLKE